MQHTTDRRHSTRRTSSPGLPAEAPALTATVVRQVASGGQVAEADEIEVQLTLRMRLTDWEALRSTARRTVEAGAWDAAERAELLQDVDSGPYGALAELMDADRLLDAVDGVELLSAVITVGPSDDEDEDGPDFADLFPLDQTLDGAEEGWLLSPRTASVLHGQVQLLAAHARNTAEELGDAPVRSESHGGPVFGSLPRLTWRQDAAWRQSFISAFDHLAADLAGGEWPEPTCPAEEMALHLVLQQAESALDEQPEFVAEQVDGLPVSPHDYDWYGCRELFFQDTDLLRLFGNPPDGAEAPVTGDLRPAAWFQTFATLRARRTD
jgi:hypothetical protein